MAKKGDTVISAVLDDDDINQQIAATLKNIENSTAQIANRMQAMSDSIIKSFNQVSAGSKQLSQDLKSNLGDASGIDSLSKKMKDLVSIDTNLNTYSGSP